MKREVDIIIPAYNSESTIKQCIESVLDQTHKEIFAHIINNNSQDRTAKIIEEYSSRFPKKILTYHEKTPGVAFARNLGIRNSKGRFLCFLDSDDWLTNESVAHRVDFLESSQALLTYGRYRKTDGFNEKIIIPPDQLNLSDLLKTNHIGNLTGMYNQEVLGRFFQKPIGHEDYEMWLNIIKNSKNALATPNYILGNYRVSKKSLSSNKIKAAKWHYNIIKNFENNYIRRIYLIINYLTNGIKKKI